LVKSNRDELIKDLDEKKELSNTRVVVLGKQESRVKENLKEVENKINKMVQIAQSGSSLSSSSTSSANNPFGQSQPK
jgi:prefoldin beta subunit